MTVSTNAGPGLLAGALWGCAAVAIWSGWWVLARSGVSGGLTPADLAALRFGLAGLVTLPLLLRHRQAIRRVPPHLLLLMVAGAGVPYVLVASTGLRFANAGNGGALATGFLPLAVALLAGLLFRERFGGRRLLAGLAILAGGGLVAGTGLDGPGLGIALPLFLASALLWAGFTLALRRSGLSALAGTAVVCTLSAAGFLPVYLLVLPHDGLAGAGVTTILLQAGYQGLLTSLVGLYCFGRAVLALGASRAAILPAFIPVAATLFGGIALGEHPSPLEVAGILSISAGAWFAAAPGTSPRPVRTLASEPPAVPTRA